MGRVKQFLRRHPFVPNPAVFVGASLLTGSLGLPLLPAIGVGAIVTVVLAFEARRN